jgi:cytochrome c biogenesis protein CcmG/thiol:disulfide interchange protein DsbE
MKYFIIALFSALFLFGSGCAKKSTQEQAASGSGPAAVKNVSEISNVTQRQDRVPNFSWKDSTGKSVDFDSFRGSVTLVNFWATWCAPCKRELPDLIALSRELAPQNIRIIGVSTDVGSDVAGDVRAFVREHGIPYQIILTNDDLDNAFGNVRQLPTSFIINKEGKIVQTLVGGRPKEEFIRMLTAALNG